MYCLKFLKVLLYLKIMRYDFQICKTMKWDSTILKKMAMNSVEHIIKQIKLYLFSTNSIFYFLSTMHWSVKDVQNNSLKTI